MDTADDPRSGAMHFLTLALRLLDESDAPADIGAHVDVAISRLSEVLGQSDRTPNDVSLQGHSTGKIRA
jgi:hypothetical protein